MITAVDTNVLIDVFTADPVFASRSAEALRSAIAHGRLVACEIVWAEASGVFASETEAQSALDRLGVDFTAITSEAALEAGRVWKAYRAKGGSRTRVAADFLIGAHAHRQADRLLTRDRGFYRTYFKHLRLLDPGRP